MCGAAAIAAALLSLGGLHAQSSVYLDYNGLTDELRSIVNGSSNASMRSIGTAHEGREVWLVTVGDPSGIPMNERPAVLVVGNLEGDHVVGSHLALETIRFLLNDPSAASVRSNQVVYVIPRLNPDGAEARVRDRLAAPELTPHHDVFFEIVTPPLVHATACRPFTLDLGKPPSDPQAQDQTALRELVDIRQCMREHGCLAQCRQQDGGAQTGPLGYRGQIGKCGERLQTWFGDDAIADPEIYAGLITQARHGPARLDGGPTCRLEHHCAVGK